MRQEVLGDEPGLALEVRAVGLVHEVRDLDLVWVLLLQSVQFRLQQDVGWGLVSVEEMDLGVVGRVLRDVVHQLVQGGDPGAGTKQGDGVKGVWLPLPLDSRALKGDSVVFLQVE